MSLPPPAGGSGRLDLPPPQSTPVAVPPPNPPVGLPPGPPTGQPVAPTLGQPVGSAVGQPAAAATTSSAPAPASLGGLSDGQWHRMHPLTPLLKGGIFLLAIIGYVVATGRDRIIEWFVGLFVPEFDAASDPEDPVAFVLNNGLILWALLGVLAVALVLVGAFYLSWRFHSFRISDDSVEVRQGVLFRSQRRAPLDRVQGVNLTRPAIGRLFGLAKVEVLGGGASSGVKLEYLTNGKAEEVRSDILALASGSQLEARPAPAAAPTGTRIDRVVDTVSSGITGLIAGAEKPIDDPSRTVTIPLARLLAARFLEGLIGAVIFLIAISIPLAFAGSEVPAVWLLLIPVLGFAVVGWFARVSRGMRYSFAPTTHGVRVTFGLFTTITEVLPPGRIHAIEIRQPLLWRPAGWWSITVNRLTGNSDGSNGNQTDQLATVLPVGTRSDVQKVLRELLPDFPAEAWPAVFQDGIEGPTAQDPYTNTPRRAAIFHPVSWRRTGFLLAAGILFLRHGAWHRRLALVPMARIQGFGLEQGPWRRMFGVASIRAFMIRGRVTGQLSGVDRDAAVALAEHVSVAAVRAAEADRSHRWVESATR